MRTGFPILRYAQIQRQKQYKMTKREEHMDNYELTGEERSLLRLLREPGGEERFKKLLKDLGLLSAFLQAMSATTQ